MSQYTVLNYLHRNDSIYWIDPESGQRQGPAVITGFYTSGFDADGHPGQGVTISGNSIPAPLIIQRVSAIDSSVMHFQNGVPVS